MLKYCVYVFAIFLGTAMSADIEEDDTVSVLTDRLFQKALDNYPLLLVKFYAPWCGNSKELAPEYANASKRLRDEDSEIKLAKMDATENARTASRYAITKYPTIKFFRSSVPIDYKGEETADGIVSWVQKLAKSPLNQLDSLKDVQDFIAKHEIAVVGMFKDKRSWAVNNFVSAAENVDGFGYEFGLTSNADVFKFYEVTNDDLVLFKRFEEGRNDFKGKRGWGVDQITKFIVSSSLPTLIEFTPEVAPRIFGSETGALFLITSSRLTDYIAHKELAEKAAQEQKGRILTVLVDAESDGSNDVLDTFGVERNELPVIRYAIGKNQKFVPRMDGVTSAQITVFIGDVQRGKIKQLTHTKSEEIPDDWNTEPVHILVGKNFHDVVNGSKKVFVLLYKKFCTPCLDLAPIWEQLGEELKDRHDVIVAKVDLSENDIDLVEIHKVPTILLFNRSDKSYVRYNDEPTMQGLLKFLRNQGIWTRNIRDEL